MDHTPTELVRRYTFEVEKRLSPEVPSRDPRRILVDGEKRLMKDDLQKEQWRTHYEPWDPLEDDSNAITKALDAKAVELSHTWRTFRKSLPENERDEIEDTVPSVNALLEMVVQKTTAVEDKKAKSKRGKFMKHFSSFCGTLDAHASMLEAIPTNDRYLCLFTGTLKTIINASSNYEKIAKGIAGALSRISENVVACQKEVDLFKTQDLQKRIADLYAHIFLYLQDTMNWYLKKSRNRLLDSFNDNFNAHFEETILSIENISNGILREANLSSKAEMRQTKSNTDFLATIASSSRVSFNNIERHMEDSKYSAEQSRLEQSLHQREQNQLINHVSERLDNMAMSFTNAFIGIRSELMGVVEKTSTLQRSVSRASANRSLTFVEGSANVFVQVQSYNRDDITFNSNKLSESFDTTRIYRPCESNTPLPMDTLASSRLREWIKAPTQASSILSITGRSQTGLELPPMTILASMCINFAIKSDLPVISYFCELSRETPPRPSNTREAQELIGLTYALIRQLMEYLPPIFDSEHDLSKQKTSSLEGTLESWDIAMELLKELLQLAPTPLFCIVDGFQILDDRSTERALVEFVEVLRSGNGLKVLFTTTGRSMCLVKVLGHGELVFADRDGAKDGAARRAGYGRFSLGE